jgi:hypothetical protein
MRQNIAKKVLAYAGLIQNGGNRGGGERRSTFSKRPGVAIQKFVGVLGELNRVLLELAYGGSFPFEVIV